MIKIDGSFGEGGGQILRSSLTLSLITSIPFNIFNIRAARKTPGLMKQHLTAVNAARTISNGGVNGAVIGSDQITFYPGEILNREYNFSIGSAGSCMLVLQTILPALIRGEKSFNLSFEGGTHNPFAPPYDFIENAFLPVLRKMGVSFKSDLERYGFYPIGGGKVNIEIFPAKTLNKINITERGKIYSIKVIGISSKIPEKIAVSEVDMLLKKLKLNGGQSSIKGIAKSIENSPGPGNVLYVVVESENITEVFTGFGKKGLPKEKVAMNVFSQVREYLDTEVPVGHYLADQLLIPFVLAGGGEFMTTKPSLHTKTNGEVIKKFVDCKIDCKELSKNKYRIKISGVKL